MRSSLCSGGAGAAGIGEEAKERACVRVEARRAEAEVQKGMSKCPLGELPEAEGELTCNLYSKIRAGDETPHRLE